MAILNSEESKLECSIFHYFVWQAAKLSACEEATHAVVVTDDTKEHCVSNETRSDADLTLKVKSDAPKSERKTRSGKRTESESKSLVLIAKYRKVVDLLRSDFSHIAKSDSPDLESTVPEVYSRWTQHENSSPQRSLEALWDQGEDSDESPEASPTDRRKRKVGGAAEDRIKGAKISRRTAVVRRPDVPKDVKEIFLNVSKENTEVKKKVALLETKLLKTELKLETQQERLKEEAKSKVERLKSRFEKKKEQLEAQQLKLKEARKRKKEEKLKELANAKKNIPWDERFDQLMEFFKEHGHCKVVRHYAKNPSLGEWVSDQRKYYRKSAPILTKERIEKLDGINFVWFPPTTQKTFETRVEECKLFKAAHGHLTIPLLHDKNADGSVPTEEQKSFRLWALSIRNQYKRRSVEGISNKLDKLKIKALEEIDFDWRVDLVQNETIEPHEDRFVDRIEQLRKVKEVCGTCNDKKSILSVFPENPSLYIWVKTQRKMYKKWKNGKVSSLTEDRREMLRGLEFDFEPRRHYAPPSKKKSTQDDEQLVDESNDMMIAEVFDGSDGNESPFI